MFPRRSAISSAPAAVPLEPCPSRGRPIDLVHLARQTLGDRGLELEVLGLMAKQIEHCGARIDLAEARDRKALAHALKGAAANVGAFALCDRAGAVEGDPTDPAALEGLKVEMTRTAAFVRTLLG